MSEVRKSLPKGAAETFLAVSILVGGYMDDKIAPESIEEQEQRILECGDAIRTDQNIGNKCGETLLFMRDEHGTDYSKLIYSMMKESSHRQLMKTLW